MSENGYGGFRYTSGAPSSPVRHKRTVRAGVCRYCGCGTKSRPSCVIQSGMFGTPPIRCSWADATRTLCTAPKCLRRAHLESRAIEAARDREKRAAAKAGKS